jgi:predicted dithiol-disulfide oxidoreductase (DUF899 family)
MADHTDGMRPHLAARDVQMIAVSRAPLAEIQPFQQRMGWRFPWVSSYGGDFNTDFGVAFTEAEVGSGKLYYNYAERPFGCTEAPGISVFFKDASGVVFHTYSTYARGVEQVMGAYAVLDLVPMGRNEDGLSYTMEWVRHHDRYDCREPEEASCCSGIEAQ